MIARPVVFVTLACLALSGCGKTADRKTDTRAAEGQVLGGTISDSMLPLATVTSTSPPDVRGDEGKPSSSATASPTAVEEAAPASPEASPGTAVAPAPGRSATPSPNASE